MSREKLLAILGSPHTAGITAAMLNRAVDAAEKAGCEVTKINLYEKQIEYCQGCRTCLQIGDCFLQDDMPDIIQQLKECHIVILAAPVYWANVPAPVKNLFDRLLGTAMEETNTFPKPRLSKKKYMLLTACKTPAPFSWICGQSRGAIRNMDEFFKTAGMKCIGKIVCANTSRISGLPGPVIRRIERAFSHRQKI